MAAAATRARGGDQLRKQAMASIAANARKEQASPRKGKPRSSSASSGTRAPSSGSADRVAAAVRTGQSAPPPTGQTAAAAAAPAPPSSPTAAAAAPSSPSSSSSTSPARSFGVEGAGAFLALFCYPLLVNLLQGGPAQMWGWVGAKWTNKPYGGVGSPGPTAAIGGQTVFLPPARTGPTGTMTRTGLNAT